MKPLTPDELAAEGKSLAPEGMMFVGDKGKIVAGFRGENPVLIPQSRMQQFTPAPGEAEKVTGNDVWIEAFKNKTESPGSFLYCGPVTETILLGAVALRARKRVEYDSVNMKITNDETANRYLTREYRKGWEM